MPKYKPCISCGIYHDSFETGAVEDAKTGTVFRVCHNCSEGENGTSEEVLKRIRTKFHGKPDTRMTLGAYISSLPETLVMNVDFSFTNPMKRADLSAKYVSPSYVLEMFSECYPFPLSAPVEGDKITQIAICFSEDDCICTVKIVDNYRQRMKRIF